MLTRADDLCGDGDDGLVSESGAVGCHRDAAASLTACRTFGQTPTPEKSGVHYLGEGCYRMIFADNENQTVYKIGLVRHGRHSGKIEPSSKDNIWNESEHERATAYRALGKSWAPPTSLYVVDGIAIVAMPYYPGSVRDATPAQLSDLHEILHSEEGLGFREDGPAWRLTKSGQIRITNIQKEGTDYGKSAVAQLKATRLEVLSILEETTETCRLARSEGRDGGPGYRLLQEQVPRARASLVDIDLKIEAWADVLTLMAAQAAWWDRQLAELAQEK